MGPRASWVSGDRSAGEGPGEPPEEEPLPRSRRGRAGGAPGPQSRTNGVHQVRRPRSREEAGGLRRRDPGARRSAEIMTRGGFYRPQRPARPPRRAIGSGAVRRGRDSRRTEDDSP